MCRRNCREANESAQIDKGLTGVGVPTIFAPGSASSNGPPPFAYPAAAPVPQYLRRRRRRRRGGACSTTIRRAAPRLPSSPPKRLLGLGLGSAHTTQWAQYEHVLTCGPMAIRP